MSTYSRYLKYECLSNYVDARDSLSYVQCSCDDETVDDKLLCHHVYKAIYCFTECIIRLHHIEPPATVESRLKMVSRLLKDIKVPVDCMSFMCWDNFADGHCTLPTRQQCAIAAFNIEAWVLRVKKCYPELSGVSVFYFAC